MATTAWAIADGFFEEGEGRRRPARAELSATGMTVSATDGEPVAVWKSVDLVRTMGPDGFRIGSRRQAGIFVFDPDTGGELIGVLARIPAADAPVRPQTLVSTMAAIVAAALVALFVLAWGAFWLIEWLSVYWLSAAS